VWPTGSGSGPPGLLRRKMCYAVAHSSTEAMEALVPTHHLSLCLEADTLERLDAESRQIGVSRSQLVKTLLEEGLRLAAHPGIVFRSGPAGDQGSRAVPTSGKWYAFSLASRRRETKRCGR
jgi:hypothetical protein